MYIDRLLLQKEAPKDTKVAWGIPQGENVAVNVHVDGKWRPINGNGGSSSSSSSNSSEGTAWPVDPDAPMLTVDNFYSIFNSKAQELGINPSTLTEEQMSQLVSSMSSVKFATPKQGNAVITNIVVEERYRIFTFQCDDGSYITLIDDAFAGLRPDIDGYIIWKTTRDKLPVRGSQEETDPEEPNPGGGIHIKSVKSGLLGEVNPSTEEVYTVINNNTGEIVDPLELHKLTNVIWYDYFGIYYPFHLNSVEDFNLYKHGIYGNSDYISNWVCMPCFNLYFTYLTVLLYYDYTLKPGNSVRIQTTNNHTITDINAFFD